MSVREIATSASIALHTAQNSITKQERMETAEIEMMAEIRKAIRKINTELPICSKSNPRDILKKQQHNWKNHPFSQAAFYGSLVTCTTSTEIARFAHESGYNPAGAFIGAVAAPFITGFVGVGFDILDEDTVNDTVSNIFNIAVSPLRYLKRAITGESFDPRLWRRNAKQITENFLHSFSKEDGRETWEKDRYVELYAESGMTPEVAKAMALPLRNKMYRLTLARHTDKIEIIPLLFEALLINPDMKVTDFLIDIETEAMALQDFGAHKSATKKGIRLATTVPNMETAQRDLKNEVDKLKGDIIGLSAVALFGNDISQEAYKARNTISEWQIQQHSSLPPSLQLMETIIDKTEQLKPHLIRQSASKHMTFRLSSIFIGKKTQDQLNASFIMLIRDIKQLNEATSHDIQALEDAMDDNELAHSVLDGYATILEQYSEAFEAQAGRLKKTSSARADGTTKITRFTPQTIDETRNSLRQQALRARQEASGYEHIIQPEQEFMVRTLPVLSARSADILKAVENAYRITRLEEMAGLLKKSGATSSLKDNAMDITSHDVVAYSRMSNESKRKVIDEVIDKLEAVLKPWKTTLQEVKDVFAIEDMTTTRLQITYQPLDEKGQSVAPSLKLK